MCLRAWMCAGVASREEHRVSERSGWSGSGCVRHTVTPLLSLLHQTFLRL